jgi:hypothetical protein
MCARLGKQLHLLGMSLGDRPTGRDARLIDFDKVGNGPRGLDDFPLIQQFATEDCVFRRVLATALYGAHTPGIRPTRMCCLISSWPRFNILAASGSANLDLLGANSRSYRLPDISFVSFKGADILNFA